MNLIQQPKCWMGIITVIMIIIEYHAFAYKRVQEVAIGAMDNNSLSLVFDIDIHTHTHTHNLLYTHIGLMVTTTNITISHTIELSLIFFAFYLHINFIILDYEQ